jgi:diadenosine tetraphosphate (Ap4A) HIT family hydrolase
MSNPPCELCKNAGGVVLYKNETYRIVRVLDLNYPAYLRVILNAHVREMTCLPKAVQTEILNAVLVCEQVLRDQCNAYKINLASLGNMTPHVHWHIIARNPSDPHFPDAIWANARRAATEFPALPTDETLTLALAKHLTASAS